MNHRPLSPSPMLSLTRRAALFVAGALLTSAALAQPAGTADGEVVKIDKPAARVTLKHNGIANLDMPPMTMAFRVSDSKLLDTLNVGDRVRFSADKQGGNYTLTSVVKAP